MPETQDITIEPPPLIFYPPHKGGDHEFDGHGPTINLIASIIKISDRQLAIEVYMDAMETEDDHTHFSGHSDRQIVFSVDEAHAGWRIVAVISDQTSSLTVTDDDHVFSEHGPDIGRLVRRFTVHGDQRGHDKPWVRVDFNPVVVRISG